MHIGMMIDTLGIHGGVRRCIELSNALIARGHWVTIFSPEGGTCDWLPTTAEILPFNRLGGYKLGALILYAMRDATYEMAMAAKTRVRALYVIGLNEQELDRILAAPKKTSTGLFRRVCADKNWLILACSTWIRDWLHRKLRSDAKLLLGGVNRSIFHPVAVRKPAGGPVIVSSGEIRQREGSIEVAHAVEVMRNCGYPDVRLQTYFRKGLTQHQMAGAIRLGDVWMDGQHYAGWANVVLEAMACRVPVVCTKIGGVADFAVDGLTALLAPVGDAEALAGGAMRLLQDEALRRRLVANAYAKSLTFNFSDTAELLEGYIEERL